MKNKIVKNLKNLIIDYDNNLLKFKDILDKLKKIDIEK
ncbi:Uncharacterised protein [Campylobacter geochelonis]|uniref:Uncharacterized protein n=1 Tax=Campylobacter geochelonis TaxID=1780362 RepID=A0A128EC96_9BACT|nr:Uncharacterised protein [Campylobacter geochelonis]